MEKTIDHFLAQLQADGYSHNTIGAYGSDLRQFYTYLRGTHPTVQSWQEVTSEHWTAYCTHLGNLGCSQSSIARKGVAVGRFAAFCGLESPVQKKASALGESASDQTIRPSLPSPTQIARLLAEPMRTSSVHARRDRALLELLCDTGLQASELVKLTVADVQRDGSSIVCGRHSQRQRRVHLSQRAAKALADYLAQRQAGLSKTACSMAENTQPLFLNYRGQRLTRQGVWLIVRTHAAAIGEHLMTPRTLRHSAAQRLLQSGAERHEVRKRLGRARLTDIPVYEQTDSFLLLDGYPAQDK